MSLSGGTNDGSIGTDCHRSPSLDLVSAKHTGTGFDALGHMIDCDLTNRKFLSPLPEPRHLLQHTLGCPLGKGLRKPALAGQLQKMCSFYFLAMTTDIHVVLTQRTLAKCQVKCWRQSPAIVLAQTPGKVFRVVITVVKQHIKHRSGIGLFHFFFIARQGTSRP